MKALINTFQRKTKKENTDLSALHFHNGYELIFVTNGEVKIEIDSVSHKAKAPAIILLNPFEQHKITDASYDYERTILVLSAEVLEQNVSPRLIAMLKCRPQGFSHIINPSRGAHCAPAEWAMAFLTRVSNSLRAMGDSAARASPRPMRLKMTIAHCLYTIKFRHILTEACRFAMICT